MAKKRINKKEDILEPVANCDHLDEVDANCDHPECAADCEATLSRREPTPLCSAP